MNLSQGDLQERLSSILIDQQEAIEKIVPYATMHEAGLSPDGRPIGVFMLLGPTGVGKTRTVEALAEVLHGSPKNILKIDCGEFQMEHEVAKLIGAPPGYLGHRETQPLLSQAKINTSASENSPICLLLFDEIEKAAPSMQRILLGVLDKGTLRLGDNSNVNFENCMIFMTSNLGAKQMKEAMSPYGFGSFADHDKKALDCKLKRIGKEAALRRFSIEFCNRIDEFVTYQNLSDEAISRIFDVETKAFSRLIYSRLGIRSFRVQYTLRGRAKLVELGVSREFGARELKRVMQREVARPIAAMVVEGRIPPGSTVVVDHSKKFRFAVRDMFEELEAA